jgi:O-antigen/teichoic acid export membrane protein
VVTAAAAPVMTDRLFDGAVWLTIAFALSLTGYAAAHLVKGTLSGTQRFGGYARFTAAESSVRFLGCAALAAVGVTTVGPYGLFVGLAPLLGVGFALIGERRLLEPGPPAPWSELWSALGALLAGSILSFGLVNLGPLAVKVLATDAEAAAASQFLVALVVARVPLYLFQAVQAALLPRLSELATLGDLDGFRDGLGRLLLLLTGIGAIGAVGAGAIGPAVVETLFGSGFAIGARTLVLLSVASGLFMVATALGQANIALGGHAWSAFGWGVGVAGFLVSVGPISEDLFLRVELASIVGCGAALLAQGWVLVALLRRNVPLETGNVLEAIVDHPLAP